MRLGAHGASVLVILLSELAVRLSCVAARAPALFVLVCAAAVLVPTSALRLFVHRSCALAPPCLLLRVAAALSGMVRGAFLVAFLVAPALLMLVLVV